MWGLRMPLPQCEGPSVLGGLRGALSVLGKERLPAVYATGAGLGLVSFSYLRCSVCNKRPKAKACGPCGFAIGEAACVHVCVCEGRLYESQPTHVLLHQRRNGPDRLPVQPFVSP